MNVNVLVDGRGIRHQASGMACLRNSSSNLSSIFRTLIPNRTSPSTVIAGKLHFRNRFSSSSSRRSGVVSQTGIGSAVKRRYDGLLLDAGGTLLQLAKPVEETYAEIGRKYGLMTTASDIKQGFKRAFSAPWPQKLRYQGDGRPFWKLLVSEATGCADNDYFEEVYEHFANGYAWHLPDGAYETILYLRDAGVKLAVVSNFDTRLRKLLRDLNVLDLFDAVVISSEVGFEKPDAMIFQAALDQIRVNAEKAVHVGDDQEADKVGANAVGIECWLWGKDVNTFRDIQDRMIVPGSSTSN